MNPTTFGFEVLIVIVARGVVTTVLGTVIAMLLRRKRAPWKRSGAATRAIELSSTKRGMAFSWLTPKQDG